MGGALHRLVPCSHYELADRCYYTSQGRWRWLKRARDLCHTHKCLVIATAISLIVGVVLGVIFSCVIGPCPPESPSCPNKWMRSEGKCYFISRETNDWNSSLEFCRSEGGTLLTTDDETQKDIKTLYDLTGDYWVGLKKEGGEWKQMDGSVWTGPIEYDDPRRSCCLLNSGNYLAIDCTASRYWICVKSVGSVTQGAQTVTNLYRDRLGSLQ
ncbi:C-type lectin domain family 2 member B-like [Bufo bufo]|uniref:C-type lectin domain family 2 member B-like n=1 Tax=Bufo bufo TaxID=8384 RepID=UPI001ABDA9C6|nr:C-type lectin domain family 2 member B-like [Bufo bufo]XP_040282971.1 C-type lectin domain family 2 member B-like [Bufo bufo]